MAELEPLYTAEEMRAAEAGHDVDALMQRAGAAVAEELMRRFPDARRIALHAGGGANGGDGRIAAEILRAQGCELVDERPDVVIDALLGTGLEGAPRDETSRVIEAINGGGVPVLAVDIPSGVNASTGEVAGAAVRADITVTMHGPKVGLAVAPGRFLAGGVVVADIGLEQAETEHRLVTPQILGEVPRRSAARQQVHGGPRPRCRRLEGHDRSCSARRTRGLSRGRRLRHDRRAGRVDSGSRDARAGGGEAAAGRCLRSGSAGDGTGRSARDSAAGTTQRRSSAGLLADVERAGGRRRRRAVRARACRVAGAARPHSARGRAWAPARAGVERGRSAPPCVGAGGGGTVRLRRRPQGRRLARRRPGTRRSRRRARSCRRSQPREPATC